jgi:hypothetical protein
VRFERLLLEQQKYKESTSHAARGFATEFPSDGPAVHAGPEQQKSPAAVAVPGAIQRIPFHQYGN